MSQAQVESGGVLKGLRIAHVAVAAISALLVAFAFVATRGAGHPSESPLVLFTLVNGGVAAFLLLVGVPLIHVLLLRPRAAAKGGLAASDRLTIGLGAIWVLCLTVVVQGVASAILWQRFAVFVPFAASAALGLLLYRPRVRA